MDITQELYANGDQNLEANLINHEATESSSSSSSSVPQTKNYKKWLYLSSYLFFVLFCQPPTIFAISWKVYTGGLWGLIFESSYVFSNSTTAVGLPIVSIIDVIAFQ
ncbi:hypothetical protein BRARA_H00942 [Brassica rapa]|uniref:Uncharacterized protein n=1 Tax=Brassica campestris TaxID=3711 RepID=A0A397YA83_BRACM|nr:hypothetical protein BRARA_H00942 [Brassica rapa]